MVTISNKTIIPMPTRHVTTMYLFLSEEQVNVVIISAIISVVLLGLSMNMTFPLKFIPLILIIGIWILFYKYSRTHEILRRSKGEFNYQIRKLQGYTTIEKYNNSIKNNSLANTIYPTKDILKNGLIHFGGNKYGHLILCTPRKTTDNESDQQVGNINRFLNSFNHKVLFKVSARSQIPIYNIVQEMTSHKINNKKTQEEKNLLYSIYNMSTESNHPTKWYFTIFLGFESDPKEIEAYSNALLPGVIKIMENARIPCRLLTDETSILNMYANDFTSIHFDGRMHDSPLFGANSIWNNLSKRLMPGHIQEKEDYIIINKNEYASCMVIGIPRGGVSGYPSDLSQNLINQLFEISISEENVIKIDLSILPIESSEGVKQIKRSMDKIDANKATAKGRQVVQQDLQIDRDDYEILLGRLKNGEDKLCHVSFIISIYSTSHDFLIAGLSKVKAILSANNTLGEIPYGRVLHTLASSKMRPFIDFNTAVELPTSAVSKITPIISNSNNMTAKDGSYFGNDGNEEIIINIDDLAAGHMLAIGSTGSGKTTGLLMMMLRDVIYLNRKVIYVSIKPDIGTKYRATAEYLGKDAQIIDLGPTNSGEFIYNINPLEILVDESAGYNAESVFYRHVSILKQFFTVLCKLDSINQIAYLELSLMELYKKFGLKPHDSKTWKEQKPPTMKDLHEIWRNDKENNVSAEALFNKTTSINYAWRFLSSPTNVDLSKKFIVIDLSGIPADLSEAMNYLLTAVLSLRFNTNSSMKTSIYIDEGRVFLKNPMLADDIVKYLTQARSYGIRLIIATQQLSDLRHVSDEFKTNTFLNLIFGNNSSNSLNVLTDYYNLSSSDQQYLKSCNKQGQALLLVGPPYNQSYHIMMKLSPLEEQIILGTNTKSSISPTIIFHNPQLEKFAEEQGVIFSDWIKGDTTPLRSTRTAVFQHRTAGIGKDYAYIKTEMIKDNHILNQSIDHFLAVNYLAGYLIMKGVKVEVNHYNDADIVAEFPDGKPVAFEYQTPGNNDPERMMTKREVAENKYGRVYFIGNTECISELKKALHDEDIIILRGKQTEALINKLLDTNTDSTDNLNLEKNIEKEE